jgi:K+-sensing histidine kinase KdpD
MQLRKHWGSIEEIVAAAVSRAAPLTRKHKVEVRLGEELPAVRVDERAVAEVLYTLIDNAAKYSPAGGRITISARSSSNGTVRLEVSDGGPGVPANLREQVFNKFFRATHENNLVPNHPQGSGMGLAIARGIVDAHGGRIWIEDSPNGHGAKVIAELPTGDQDPAETKSEPPGQL